LASQVRAARANDCAACHMPKRKVAVISHSALTNHRIVAYPGQPWTPPPSSGNDLVYVNRPPGDRTPPPLMTLLTAYGELSQRSPALMRRYLELLDIAAKEQPARPLVEAALGRKALRENPADPRAIEHLSKAIELGFRDAPVFEDLAQALVQTGRREEATDVLKRGIEAQPFASVLYSSLARLYLEVNAPEKSKTVTDRYLELFPQDSHARDLLRKVH